MHRVEFTVSAAQSGRVGCRAVVRKLKTSENNFSKT